MKCGACCNLLFHRFCGKRSKNVISFSAIKSRVAQYVRIINRRFNVELLYLIIMCIINKLNFFIFISFSSGNFREISFSFRVISSSWSKSAFTYFIFNIILIGFIFYISKLNFSVVTTRNYILCVS